MDTAFYLFKVFHIIGFVAWFSGMFYLVRMFVYHREAMDRTEPQRSILIEQYKIMEGRVYRIIMTPAMNITWICGIAMILIHGMEWFKMNNWLHIKIFLLVILSWYHYYCKDVMGKLALEKSKFNPFQFRLMNEVPTLFLLAIVLLAVFKNSINAIYIFLAVILFGFLLFLGAKWYRRIREKAQ
jgi:putative membrane protein